MKTAYYISGLGADERVFSYLKLNGVKEKFVRWVVPEEREKLQGYCKRLLPQIDLSDDIILVGVSFGGIVAQEISKIIKVDKVIIISSIKNAKEFDWKLSCVRFLKLHRLVPSRFLKWSNLLIGNYYFDTQSKAESDLLKIIIKETGRFFMKWAISEIMRWNNNHHVNTGVTHIHGDNDRIFPIKRIKNAIPVKSGGHFMIVNRANEIAQLIEKVLE